MVISSKIRAIILSHKEDVDGIVSAALLYSYLTNNDYDESEVLIQLFDYISFVNYIQSQFDLIKKLDLFISDFGLNEKIFELFLKFERLESINFNVVRYYFDHHTLVDAFKSSIDSLASRFSLYSNPSLIDHGAATCSAEVIFKKLGFKNTHFRQLCEFAHCIDFKEKNSKSFNEAALLQKYISFNQNNWRNLYELVINMNDVEKWEETKKRIDAEKENIELWYKKQHEMCQKNIVQYTKNNCRIILSFGHLKSEEIVNYLMRLHENYEVYIGFSLLNNYTNIQTRAQGANLIASKFGGGGHPCRAGFKIPNTIYQYIKNDSFDMVLESAFLKEIINFLEN